jgi:hypothetical protein
MDAMGKDWPKWGCKHADDMEDLEYIFRRACKERERKDWIAEVKKLKQQHANECVKQGIKPNKNWQRKIWFRKDRHRWNCTHAKPMKELEFLYSRCMPHEVALWKGVVLQVRKKHQDECVK